MSVRLLLMIVAVATVGAANSLRQATAAPQVVRCGVERWTVKTLQDKPILRPARLTSLRYLVTRRPPSYLPPRRLPFERNVYTVVVAVTLVRAEEDGDLHIVLANSSRTMIAEAPTAGCTLRARPVFRRAMAIARSYVRACSRARVTGVAFFDYHHGQTGVAPNGIELHPILGFHCLAD